MEREAVERQIAFNKERIEDARWRMSSLVSEMFHGGFGMTEAYQMERACYDYQFYTWDTERNCLPYLRETEGKGK